MTGELVDPFLGYYRFNKGDHSLINRKSGIVIFIDHRKAFETIDYILLKTFLHYAICRISMWNSSYLSSRQQYKLYIS